MQIQLQQITPPSAGHPFDRYDVQEAVSANGPWATIGTGILDPLDVNPQAPQTRTITANSALAEGFFRVAWICTDPLAPDTTLSVAFALSETNPTRVVRGVQSTAPARIVRVPVATLRRT